MIAMTNKPMLSIELRALLERLLSHDFAEECQECGIGYSDAWSELRALLDADKVNSREMGLMQYVDAHPIKSAKTDLVECDACPTSGGCVSVCMKAPKTAAQHQGEPVAYQIRRRTDREDSAWTKWQECSEMERAMHSHEVGKYNRFGIMREIRALYAEQSAPVADHTQCEECKGWGYHENHHEGGGTECGECGGSGNASAAEMMVMPDRMKVEPFTTIDRGSKNYKAGYNAAIAEVAKLNGLKT